MASNITLSAGVRQNLLSLQNTANLMSMTQNRLATGKKVNSALDNPTNFFTSASLRGRASDMGALLDAMSNGIKTLEAADNGLTAITKTVESMQSGVIYGYTALVDGMVNRIEAELGEKANVVSTGGLSGLITPLSETIDHHEPWLTLHGLRLIYEKNR